MSDSLEWSLSRLDSQKSHFSDPDCDLFGYHGNQCLKPDSAPIPYLPAKFGARRSINAGVVAEQTNTTMACSKCSINALDSRRRPMCWIEIFDRQILVYMYRFLNFSPYNQYQLNGYYSRNTFDCYESVTTHLYTPVQHLLLMLGLTYFYTFQFIF